MREQMLNSRLLLHIHKQLTDNCDLIEVARQFCAVSDECRKHFGAIQITMLLQHASTQCDVGPVCVPKE